MDVLEFVYIVLLRDSLLDVIEDEVFVYMCGIVWDEVFRNLLVVIGKINICIVGRKFSMDVVCEEGM